MQTLSVNIDHIIAGCQRYEAPMQEALYKHCYPTMMGVCMRYTENRDDAAAMYNEAMLKVLQNIQQYTHKGEFMGWVRRIVANTCIDNCRKQVKYVVKALSEEKQDEYSVDNRFEEAISSQQVVEWLQALPTSTALVFNMYCMEGYPLHEVSERLSITTGTAKWHISEARKTLREKLQQFNYKKLQTNAS